MNIQMALVDENNVNLLGDYFDEIKIFESYIMVKKASKCGIYKKEDFSCILKCVYDNISIHEVGFKVSTNGLYGFYTIDGKNITEGCVWDKISIQRTGVIVEKDKLQGFFDYEGSKICDCEYRKIECYSKVIVAFKSKKRYVYDIV